ncbi:MAG: YidC/Oxa1 family insertase periplasmic-domain containing protein, partial [Duncaniella sp.]|nr:YidC/Oxa1 family insertase periplasmic-domain containing protein [Duncaniella sp.]
MDKNSLTGLLLMGLVIFGFMWLNRPSAEELERQRQEQARIEAEEARKAQEPGLITLDSITADEVASIVRTVRTLGATDTVTGVSTLKVDKINLTVNADGKVEGTVIADGQQVAVAPLLANNTGSMSRTLAAEAVTTLRKGLATAARYRGFARHLSGDSTTVTLANKFVTLEIANKGGVISRAALNDYRSYDSTQVTLLDPSTDLYSFTLTTPNQRFETSEFYFEPVAVTDTTVTMMLDLGDGAKWGLRYTLLPESYLVNVDIVQQGMEAILPSSTNTMDFTWRQKMRRLEAGRVFEERNSALYYMFPNGDVDNLSENSDDDEEINERVKWVSCKNQFFSAVLMARENFTSADLESTVLKDNPDYIKSMDMHLTLEYKVQMANPASFVMQ